MSVATRRPSSKPGAARPLTTSPATAILLGPQEVEPNAAQALGDLGLSEATGAVALVTAGWQERESEDEALIKALGMQAVNLALHARSETLFAEDAELTKAYKARQERLRHMQSFYRVRLEAADDAAHAIGVRHVDPELLVEEWKVSVDVFRGLDADHLERCRRVHHAFEEQWKLAERPAVARHREELAALIAPTSALVIAGGHVGSLLNRLRLFDVVAMAQSMGKPIVAWSAGAMVLTDRIVCFHDYPPYGKDIAQVLDFGFGLAPDLVVLPDPRRRVRLDDQAGIGRFAQRMAPAACLALDHGAHVAIHAGRAVIGKALKLTETGQVEALWNRATGAATSQRGSAR
ncbi:MAG: hypothetical protein U1F43_21760 [Myxococcota bacterium]